MGKVKLEKATKEILNKAIIDNIIVLSDDSDMPVGVPQNVKEQLKGSLKMNASIITFKNLIFDDTDLFIYLLNLRKNSYKNLTNDKYVDNSINEFEFINCKFSLNSGFIATYTYSQIDKCRFEKCMFDRINIISNICFCTFKNCIFNNINIQDSIYRCIFEKCIINNTILMYTVISNSHFINNKIDFKNNIITTREISRCAFVENEYFNTEFDSTNKILTDFHSNTIKNDDIMKIMSPWYPLACPSTGEFKAYKGCYIVDKQKFNDLMQIIQKHDRTTIFEETILHSNMIKGNALIELTIPDNAKRSSALTAKCRASEAVIEKIITLRKHDENTVLYVSMFFINGLKSFHSRYIKELYDSSIYEVGKTIKIDNFDEDRFNECSTGIHFFMSDEEARKYMDKYM